MTINSPKFIIRLIFKTVSQEGDVANTTTLVGLSRLKDFEFLANQIGSYVPSSLPEPPLGTLRVSVEGAEASKTEWAALYEKIGGEDGSTPDKFKLPYVPKQGNLEYYLIGKVLYGDLLVSGNTISQTFTKDDLDDYGYYVFNHGIEHLNPIIQVTDEDGGQVTLVEVINTTGSSKIKIGYHFTGTWKATAIG